MKRAALIAGGGLAVVALWLGSASYLLQQWLIWADPPRFHRLAFTPLLWADAAPLMTTDRLVGQLIPVTAAVASIPALLVAGLAFRLATWRAKRPLHGASKFSGVAEGKKTGLIYSRHPRPDCLILGRTSWLGRYVCLPGVEHVILYAKTGSGKGVSYVVPNCFNYADSLVVLDIKQENHRRTAAHRRRMGHAVYLFNPLAADGCTHCWNPLGDVSPSSPDYISRLQRKAFDIFPETMGKERFWQDGARSAFLGIAVLVAETPELTLNPETVFRFFSRGDGAEVLARLIEERRKAGTPYSQTCVDMISDYLNGTEEVVKGVRKHVTATMGLWFNPKIAAATAKSDFSLRDLRRRRMTVYVAVMPSDIGQLGVLLRLFFQQLFEANTDTLPENDRSIRYRCHVLLDEFTSLPQMKAFAKAAGFARGFGLHFSYVVQSKNQIKEEYRGQGEASLLENVGAEIIFGTNDPQLCKEASERTGYDTVESISETRPTWWPSFRWNRQSQTAQIQKRALLLPQEVARMKADEELMFRASAPAFLLKKLRWYDDSRFRELEGKPPALPVVAYQLARDDGTVRISEPKSKESARLAASSSSG